MTGMRQKRQGAANGVGLGADTPKCGSADQMALDVERVADRRVGGGEFLG